MYLFIFKLCGSDIIVTIKGSTEQDARIKINSLGLAWNENLFNLISVQEV